MRDSHPARKSAPVVKLESVRLLFPGLGAIFSCVSSAAAIAGTATFDSYCNFTDALRYYALAAWKER
jgi:hypothetical protein